MLVPHERFYIVKAPDNGDTSRLCRSIARDVRLGIVVAQKTLTTKAREGTHLVISLHCLLGILADIFNPNCGLLPCFLGISN